MITDALSALIDRHSLGIRHLAEPGPSAQQLLRMAEAALHAPDHAELTPFRFKAISGDARARLAQLFEYAAREGGKDEAGARLDVERALKAPVTVAVLARIDRGHPLVPEHEQWIAVGGALANFMNAAHLMGFAGKMLYGAKVRNPHVAAAFCDHGEQLVGWIALGTATRPPASRAAKSVPQQALIHWT
ncbi:MAG: nitroreductase [Betaproteobacteria bacterium]|nr:nitroreductase [Betaproteobacteria bacterium]